MKKGGKGFSVAVLSAVALGAVGIGILLAFLAGYFLGHSTGHTSTTTVSVLANAPEAETDEPAEAEAKAEEEAAKAAKEEAEAVEEEAEAEEGAKAEEEAAEKEPSKGKEQGEAKGEGGSAGGGGASLAAGETAFKTNCAGCHTLAEAGTTGTVGPNLDQLQPDKALVEKQVTNGGGGMPAFGGTLSRGEIEAIAEYVSTVAGTGA